MTSCPTPPGLNWPPRYQVTSIIPSDVIATPVKMKMIRLCGHMHSSSSFMMLIRFVAPALYLAGRLLPAGVLQCQASQWMVPYRMPTACERDTPSSRRYPIPVEPVHPRSYPLCNEPLVDPIPSAASVRLIIPVELASRRPYSPWSEECATGGSYPSWSLPLGGPIPHETSVR